MLIQAAVLCKKSSIKGIKSIDILTCILSVGREIEGLIEFGIQIQSGPQ
jgi:hypothetical protein